jgi:hypothetical protein
MKHPAQEALEFLLGLTAKFSHDPSVAKRANEHLAALADTEPLRPNGIVAGSAVVEYDPGNSGPSDATNDADPAK